MYFSIHHVFHTTQESFSREELLSIFHSDNPKDYDINDKTEDKESM